MEKIGRYEIIKELGRGGMAIVYLARDPKFKQIEHLVAIKVLPQQLTFDPRFRARFEREANTLASLQHTGIVPVHDYGEENDRPYLVMRYMPGGSLRDRIQKRGMPITQVSRILERIVSAMDMAHRRGIIHRDIKPENILFNEDDEPFIGDFGIAKLAESSQALSETLILGTAAYMSPEQAHGKAGLDGRSDQYSLAVMVFEMLTGRSLFKANTPMGLVHAHVNEPPLSIQKFRNKVPAQLAVVLEKAVSKKPKDRYPSVSKFLVAFKSAMTEPEKTSPRHDVYPPDSTIIALPYQAAPETRVIKAKRIPKTAITGKLVFPRIIRNAIFVIPIAVLLLLLIIFRPKPITLSNAGQIEKTDISIGNSESLNRISWSPDGERLALAGFTAASIRDATTGSFLLNLANHNGSGESVVWSPDGTLLATSSSDGLIRILDSTDGGLIRQISGHSDLVESVAWSPDGEMIVSGSWDGTARIWDAATGDELQEFGYHLGPVSIVAWSPDGEAIASGGYDGTVRVWNPSTGALIMSLRGHSQGVESVAWSPDGSRIASGSFDETINIWNRVNGDLLLSLSGHKDLVESLAWSNGGQILASASWDRTVRLWNSTSGELLVVLTGHTGFVTSVIWSPDNTKIATAGFDGRVIIWGLPPN